MYFEDVDSEQELNQKVTVYMAVGYEIENRTPKYAKLVKDDFSWGIFIILFLFLIIGALIYWAVKSGNKDEIIIRVKENTSSINTDLELYKYCENCEIFINEDLVFCGNCGKQLNETLYVNIVNCPFCREKIPNNIDRCDYCGEWLGGEKKWDTDAPPIENIYKK